MTVAEARTGVVLRDPLPWRDEREVVETVEATGYDAIFVPESDAREAFSALAGFAGVAARPLLGTGVVPMWSRSPTATAMAAATVQELSGGRFVLGVGAGGGPRGVAAEAFRGLSPLAAVEAYTRVVRQALAGEPVGPGDVFGAEGFRLRLDPGAPVPIWLAALGDGMVGLAGRVADGVLLNWCTPERVASARATLREAAERAGRDAASITVAVYVRACLGQEDEVALPPLARAAAQYASYPGYRRQFEAMGLAGEAAAAAAAARAADPVPGAGPLARALVVTGGRAEATGRFAAYREAGADLVLCYPVLAGHDAFSSLLGTVMAAAPRPALER